MAAGRARSGESGLVIRNPDEAGATMESREPLAGRVPAPSRVEAGALEEAVRYLRRAGTQTATLILLAVPSGEHELLELLRDELPGCAAFCESVLELVSGRPARD